MLNLDFTKRVVINTDDMAWVNSPAKGVMRKPLARAEQESGHATSIVAYQKGSKFKQHAHPFGEEIFVLDGVFSDENGDYPKGSYLRNPPGSRHAPFSNEGCILFVKLHQFDPNDNKQLAINTNEADWQQIEDACYQLKLHKFGSEIVRLIEWTADQYYQSDAERGEEILVLSGQIEDEYGIYPSMTWLRNPVASTAHRLVKQGTVALVKTGHL